MAHKPFVQDKSPSHRPARYAHRIKEELSQLIPGDLQDPRLADIGFITITNVVVTQDLRNATVNFALMGEPKKAKAVEAALNGAAGYLRRELMALLESRITPHLSFKYDKGFENTLKIDALLKQVAAEPKPETDPSSDDSNEE